MPAIDSDLDAMLATMGAYEKTFAETPRTSIRRTTTTTGLADAMSALQRGDTSASLAFEGVLGKGGMGTVHLAQQRSLGRNVAVKRLHAGDLDAVQSKALLSEGWVMGALEHPNIPPVHDAMLDEEGAPMLLLKRIEGDEWTHLMSDAETVRNRFAESLLDWNLGVLDTVCNALSYAHSKGIVHRDLKPENVMIGAFGEVYVLDWGIAVALHKDPNGRLPFVGDSRQPAGTPCFMAPELLDADPSGVDTRTDVYLLGGILYELLVGRPPHPGKSMRAVAASILKSEPAFPKETPAPLVQICQKAMRANPGDRYASVEEMQLAMRRYQQRRASQRLTEEATERLETLRELAGQPTTEELSAQMSSLFSECRFAFRQVLASYPDEGPASTGLADATELMARHALASGQLDAAKTYARDLEEAPEDLLADMAALAARETDNRARLAQLERQQDSDVGKGTRILLVALFAAIMTGGSLGGELVKRIAPDHLRELTVLWQVMLFGSFVVGFRRVALEQTENNRLTFIIISTALIGQLLATITAWATGFPIETTMLIDSAVWVTASLIAVLSMGRIYLPAVLGYTLCMATVAWQPEYMYYGIAMGNVVMAINAGIVYILKIIPKSLIPPVS